MKNYFVLFTIIFLFVPTIFSQGKKELKTDDTFTLHEKQAYIIKDKGNYKIQFLAPEHLQYPAYKNVDLRKDDIIMMINGRVVKQAADLHEEYDKLKPGHDIKLELKRGGKILTVSFKKAKPDELPMKVVKPDDKRMDNKVILAGYGILIGKINEKPMIEKIFHEDNELVKKASLKGGDLITNINGQGIKTFDQFKIAYESIAPGQEVRIKFGDKFISFKKNK